MNSYNPVFEFGLMFLFAVIGLCLGSFATAVIYREKIKKSWFQFNGHSSRSFCPHCNLNLGARDLVPVFSWVFLKGKCRNCSAPIPIFYPAIEVLCCVGAVVIYLAEGLSALAFSALLCMPFFISLIYLGVIHKSFSWRLVIIISVIGLGSFFLQVLTLK